MQKLNRYSASPRRDGREYAVIYTLLLITACTLLLMTALYAREAIENDKLRKELEQARATGGTSK